MTHRCWAMLWILSWLAAPSAAQVRFAELGPRHLPRAEDAESGAIAVGDLDGDRDLDFVRSEGWRTPPRRVVFRNGGSAVFDVSSTVVFSSSSQASGVGLADFDRDGDLDLLILAAPGLLFWSDGASIAVACGAPSNTCGATTSRTSIRGSYGTFAGVPL